MERIARALELARAQRDGRNGAATLDDRREPRPDADEVESASLSVLNATHAGNGSFESNAREFGDTRVIHMPVAQLAPERREDRRILAPGSSGAAAAPYKMLRTQVLKRMDQLNANSLVILSATSGAGKTLTAINLAIAIAADPGRTALLVDLDLRNPSVHAHFDYQPKVGIEDCLRDGRPLSEAMFRVSGYDKLTIMGARSRVAGSSDLLRSQRVEQAVMEMRKRYTNRILIFDLPPALQADDALAFSRYMQAGLLVVAEGRSQRDDVTRTLELLHDLPIVGTVLNGSRDAKRAPY